MTEGLPFKTGLRYYQQNCLSSPELQQAGAPSPRGNHARPHCLIVHAVRDPRRRRAAQQVSGAASRACGLRLREHLASGVRRARVLLEGRRHGAGVLPLGGGHGRRLPSGWRRLRTGRPDTVLPRQRLCQVCTSGPGDWTHLCELGRAASRQSARQRRRRARSTRSTRSNRSNRGGPRDSGGGAREALDAIGDTKHQAIPTR